MRARIADEFDLYSAGLHTIVAFHELSKVKPKVTFDRAQYVLEATHFPHSGISPAVLPSIRGVTAITAADPSLLGADGHKPSLMQIELLNQDSETIPSVLDQYIRRSARNMYQQETSPFLRPTLALASELSQQKSEPLLTRSLELWTATQMLGEPGFPWRLSSITNKISDNGTTQRTTTEPGTALPVTYRLLVQQLHAQTEKRCAHLAKSLMNDLERRLLQRGQTTSSHFETFLTSIILLTCVEKMCCLFHTWDIRTSQNQLNLNVADSAVHDMWPLDKPAAEYVAKGALVADVVSMLLRMRSVPPATVVGTDGIIHFDARAAGKGGDGQDEERNAVIAAWFESVALRWEDLLRMRDMPEDRWSSAAGAWKGWDGRFVCRLLLGDG